MKYLWTLIILVNNMACANPLDVTIKKVNKKLNPTHNGETGYEIDYRSDGDFTWVNIVHVQLVCAIQKIHYLTDGKFVTLNENNCVFKEVESNGGNNLRQIACTKSRSRCINRLHKEISSDSIRAMIKENINEAIVK